MQPRSQIRSSWLYAACLGLVVLLPTATWSQPKDAAALSPQNAERARQALIAWFECEECENGELKAVASFGQAVVPNLIGALNEGTSPPSRALLRQQLEERYDSLMEAGRKNPQMKIESSKNDFVNMYISNFDAQYRVRAAQALGAIGGSKAHQALEAALGKAGREDLQATIKETLVKMRQ
jgi:hypothetical protein